MLTLLRGSRKLAESPQAIARVSGRTSPGAPLKNWGEERPHRCRDAWWWELKFLGWVPRCVDFTAYASLLTGCLVLIRMPALLFSRTTSHAYSARS